MKILIVQDYLRSGGTERHSIFLASAAAQAGHTVTLLTFRPGGVLAAEAAQHPFTLRSLLSFDTGLDWYAPGLRRTAREIAPALVICMGHMANCYGGFLQSALPHAAVVCTLRDARPLPWLFRRSLRLCRHIIVNSHAAKRVLTDHYDVAAPKVSVLHNPLLCPIAGGPRNLALREKHHAGPATTVLLCVAMFRPKKNHRELIELCARLPADLNWQLWLAGEGAALEACRQFVRDKKLEPQVRFLGYQPDSAPLYLAADLAVLASQSESLSNFLIEAQFHGLPAVAYDVSGVGECFVPGESGYLIPNRDQSAFHVALEKFIRDPGQRQRFGARAAEHTRAHFATEQQTRRHLELFAQIAGGN